MQMLFDIAVIFDMDGVIVDSNPFHKVSLHYFVRRYGHYLSETELKKKGVAVPIKNG